MKLPPILDVIGATAPSLTRYVIARKGDRSAWIPYAMLVDERAAKLEAANQGLPLLKPEWNALVEAAMKLEHFPHADVVERPGWTGRDFILSNGEMVARTGAQELPLVFNSDASACQTTGTFKGYRAGVIKPLRGQHLMTLLLCINFAAPLLELTGRVGNFGFQIVGGPGTGKSTAQRIAAAACGANYWISFNTTLEALEQQMRLYNSMPAWIDEVNLFGADKSDSVRGGMIRAVAFRIASGDLKSRYNEATKGSISTIYCASGNDTLEQLISGSKATSKAAIDRLMTIKLGRDRKHGIFEFIPPKFKSGKQFAEALEAAANAHAGHVMREYLRHLANARAHNEEALIALVRSDMERFSERAGVDQDNGSAARVGDSFGLMLAGGLMARRYGIFPKDFPIGDAILYCYQHLLVGAKATVPIDAELRRFFSKPGVRDLDKKGLRGMSDRLFNETTAFLKDGEAIVAARTLTAEIPDWYGRLPSSKAGVTLVAEAGRRTTKRRVRKGKSDRMIVLVLPKGFIDAA